MSMKKIFTSIAILLFTLGAWGQNNMGTPYSKFGVGLLPDNYGAYTGMGGVSAAMRDNYYINSLNPASYTALDSMRFYSQMGVTREYVDFSTYKEVYKRQMHKYYPPSRRPCNPPTPRDISSSRTR